MLKFPDGTQISLNGLDEILVKVYLEDKLPNQETADEIINRLEQAKNYIPESYSARKEYQYVLLRAYREYIDAQQTRHSD